MVDLDPAPELDGVVLLECLEERRDDDESFSSGISVALGRFRDDYSWWCSGPLHSRGTAAVHVVAMRMLTLSQLPRHDDELFLAVRVRNQCRTRLCLSIQVFEQLRMCRASLSSLTCDCRRADG